MSPYPGRATCSDSFFGRERTTNGSRKLVLGAAVMALTIGAAVAVSSASAETREVSHAAAAPTAWAKVRADGVLLGGSGISAIRKLGTGRYALDIYGNLADCALLGTINTNNGTDPGPGSSSILVGKGAQHALHPHRDAVRRRQRRRGQRPAVLAHRRLLTPSSAKPGGRPPPAQPSARPAPPLRDDDPPEVRRSDRLRPAGPASASDDHRRWPGCHGCLYPASWTWPAPNVSP
uniref:Uncharacterized protein n=1 Tax=Streptomyces avermitilis TaxID=33903 RepID=A0A499VJG7_STRAX|nr:hypothetical protein SAVMC3_09750 [Streptomyces avermitilis]